MLMLEPVLTSCASSEPEKIYIFDIPAVSWPDFPDPWPVVFYDVEGNIVLTDDVEIWDVQVPYWYWNRIIEYKAEVDVIKNSLHPP